KTALRTHRIAGAVCARWALDFRNLSARRRRCLLPERPRRRNGIPRTCAAELRRTPPQRAAAGGANAPLARDLRDSGRPAGESLGCVRADTVLPRSAAALGRARHAGLLARAAQPPAESCSDRGDSNLHLPTSGLG